MNDTDKQFEKDMVPPTPVAAEPVIAPVNNIAEAKPIEKHRTVGNWIYDWGVYTTFAWGGVALASALSAHEAMHGNNKAFNWLRSLNDNCIKGLSNILSKTLLKGRPKDVIHGWAKGSTMFVTLGLGGWAMMAPIKWMEDNRQRNAGRIDNALGTTPPDPSVIEHEPKQTWHSVLSGRMFSWAMSYAAFCAMGPKTTSKINDAIGNVSSRIWMAIRPSSNAASVRKWADIAAFDALFTVITASLTYLWSRHVAREDEVESSTKPTEALKTTPLETSPAQVETRYADANKPMKKLANAPKLLHTDKILVAENQAELALGGR